MPFNDKVFNKKAQENRSMLPYGMFTFAICSNGQVGHTVKQWPQDLPKEEWLKIGSVRCSSDDSSGILPELTQYQPCMSSNAPLNQGTKMAKTATRTSQQ